MRVKNKSVPIMAVPSAGTRCHAFILDTYLGKFSPEALEQDNFYVQPATRPRTEPEFAESTHFGRHLLTDDVLL